MKRRSFVSLVGCVLLSGCGGGSSEKKRTVRGIVLEDDGAGNVRTTGAGRRITARNNLTPDVGEDFFDVVTTTDAEGRFSVALPLKKDYIFLTDGYPSKQENQFSCTTQPGVVVFPDSSIQISYVTQYTTALPVEWRNRAAALIPQYGVDVVILADLACVGQPQS